MTTRTDKIHTITLAFTPLCFFLAFTASRFELLSAVVVVVVVVVLLVVYEKGKHGRFLSSPNLRNLRTCLKNRFVV